MDDTFILTTLSESGQIRRRLVEKEQLSAELQSWFATSTEQAFIINKIGERA